MNLSIRRWHYWGLAALAVATCAVVALSLLRISAATKFAANHAHGGGLLQHAGPDRRPWPSTARQFEAAHPGVKIKRQYVPFANLNTKLLTQAAGHALPNLLAVDNPFVSTMISTGQVIPLGGLKGFSTKGYFPGDHQ